MRRCRYSLGSTSDYKLRAGSSGRLESLRQKSSGEQRVTARPAICQTVDLERGTRCPGDARRDRASPETPPSRLPNGAEELGGGGVSDTGRATAERDQLFAGPGAGLP